MHSLTQKMHLTIQLKRFSMNVTTFKNSSEQKIIISAIKKIEKKMPVQQCQYHESLALKKKQAA